MNLQDYLAQYHTESVATTSHHHLRSEPTGDGNFAVFIKPLSSAVPEVAINGDEQVAPLAPAAQEQPQPKPIVQQQAQQKAAPKKAPVPPARVASKKKK